MHFAASVQFLCRGLRKRHKINDQFESLNLTCRPKLLCLNENGFGNGFSPVRIKPLEKTGKLRGFINAVFTVSLRSSAVCRVKTRYQCRFLSGTGCQRGVAYCNSIACATPLLSIEYRQCLIARAVQPKDNNRCDETIDAEEIPAAFFKPAAEPLQRD